MKKKVYLIITTISLILFVLTFILCKFVDKGQAGSFGEVGLYHINKMVHYKYSKSFDLVCDVILYLSFIFPLTIAALGLYQLIKRKSLLKVDKVIYIYASLLILAVILWLVFDKVVEVNVRPTHKNENSFPSTHVLVSVFFILSGAFFASKYLKLNQAIYDTIYALAGLLILLISVFRIKCGMHYITDVVAALFLSIFLFGMLGFTNELLNKGEE